MQVHRLRSEEDASVNFVFPTSQGALEARYVRREGSPHFICYLSSHTGCDRACRFCHLTAMGETSMAPAMIDDYHSQALSVMHHWSTLGERADLVHFNFMARGEPLANPVILVDFKNLAICLRKTALFWNVPSKFNVSTIMPREIERIQLSRIFDREAARDTALYYSIYSMEADFRRRWLPKAMDPLLALDKLAAWQQDTGGEVVLHHALIKDENDQPWHAHSIYEHVRRRGLKARFNLVRYNAFDPARGEEPSDEVIQEYLRCMRDGLGDDRSKIVPRVGFDVKASCGMFVDQEGLSCH